MTLTDQLNEAAQAHIGTGLGKLLTWAALHIESQAVELDETRQELATEEAERTRLEEALHASKASVESALMQLQAAWCPPIELGRDMAPHINLMAGHGDPDYLRKNGNSIRHIDCREEPAKRKKA